MARNTRIGGVTQPLLADASIVYAYDGTFEGLLTALFKACNDDSPPSDIQEQWGLQQSMLCSYIDIETSIADAQAMQQTITSTLGACAFDEVRQVFLSDEGSKGKAALAYLQYAMPRGKSVLRNCANPAIAQFAAIRDSVVKEAHFIRQFVRFAELANGVYYSRIDPKAAVVPLVMGHFAARFNIQPFIIYDTRHRMAGVFDTEKWWLVEAASISGPPNGRQQSEPLATRPLAAELPQAASQHALQPGAGLSSVGSPPAALQDAGLSSVGSPLEASQDAGLPNAGPPPAASLAGEQSPARPLYSASEQSYQALWQAFYETIAIEERKNPACQRNFMPKRFWKNMCEHVPRQAV